MTDSIIYKDESYKIMGACYEVYKNKGCGFLETVYQECLAIELKMRNIPYAQKPRLKLSYKDHILKQEYEPDFLCFDKIILEIKAVKCLADDHRAQVINYLRATDKKLGILLNFGHYPMLEEERFLNV